MQRNQCISTLALLLEKYTTTQKIVLLELSELEGLNLTAIARIISNCSGLPLSTVKYALKKFQNDGLVVVVPRCEITAVYFSNTGKEIVSIVQENTELNEGVSECVI